LYKEKCWSGHRGRRICMKTRLHAFIGTSTRNRAAFVGCKLTVMRRLSAILLLALFSFSLIGQAVVASDAEASLPACCRRNGKHRCAMVMETRTASTSGPSVLPGACPSFPIARAVPASANTGLPKASPAVFAWIPSRLVSCTQAESLLRVWLGLAGQKRGPPLSFS